MTARSQFSTVPEAITAVGSGRPVVVADAADRENEGDLIFAASLTTPGLVAFCVRHTSGVICAALDGSACDRLGLPPMVESPDESMGTAFTVTVDVREGTTTGISASDRAATIRALADHSTNARDLARPGHIFPLRARDGGVLTRPGHTEAAIDLASLAGLPRAGVLAEIVAEDGEMARVPELLRFAAEHGLAMITIEQLVEYRCAHESLLLGAATARPPTRHGPFLAHFFDDEHGRPLSRPRPRPCPAYQGMASSRPPGSHRSS